MFRNRDAKVQTLAIESLLNLSGLIRCILLFGFFRVASGAETRGGGRECLHQLLAGVDLI